MHYLFLLVFFNLTLFHFRLITTIADYFQRLLFPFQLTDLSYCGSLCHGHIRRNQEQGPLGASCQTLYLFCYFHGSLGLAFTAVRCPQPNGTTGFFRIMSHMSQVNALEACHSATSFLLAPSQFDIMSRICNRFAFLSFLLCIPGM